MSKPCRPRTIITVTAQSFPPIIDRDPTHLDQALEYLCARDPATDEVIVSTMELMSISHRASTVISTTSSQIEAALKKSQAAGSQTELQAAVTEARSAMELLMAMGFLAGTAIGFATGLEMEADDGDGDDDPV